MSFDQEKQDSESRFIPQNYNGSAQTIIIPQISWSTRIQGKTRKRRAGGNGKKGIYQAFLVVLSLGIHTHDHPNFPFSIKVVLEEMSQFGISVRNHLGITATEDPSEFSLSRTWNSRIIREGMPTLFVPYNWFSRRTSMHVLNVIRDWLIFPKKKKHSVSSPWITFPNYPEE